MIPDYLTRYYTVGDDPFLSLNDLPLEEAKRVKLAHCKRNNIGGYYSEDEYLMHRKNVEQWIYSQLIAKGGTPRNSVPVYMALGESPTGEFDIRADIQRNCSELRIPISALDLGTVTFTYPDSLIHFDFDKNGNCINAKLTSRPNVYLYHELEEIIEKYHVYREPYEHYIEAQIWNRDMLYDYYYNLTK